MSSGEIHIHKGNRIFCPEEWSPILQLQRRISFTTGYLTVPNYSLLSLSVSSYESKHYHPIDLHLKHMAWHSITDSSVLNSKNFTNYLMISIMTLKSSGKLVAPIMSTSNVHIFVWRSHVENNYLSAALTSTHKARNLCCHPKLRAVLLLCVESVVLAQ